MPIIIPPCRPARIAIVADDGGGVFDGMSHGGTCLYLRNRRAKACSLPALPLVRFLDRGGRVLPAVRSAAAAPPVTVEPVGRVSLSLRWVSGPVHDHSRCLRATGIAVTIGAGVVRAHSPAHVCGPAGAKLRFDQTALKPIADYPAE